MNKICDGSKNKSIIVSLIVYKFLLDFGYVTVLKMQYEGSYDYSFDFTLWKYIIGWLTTLILIYILPRQYEKTSVFFLHVIFAISQIPFASMFAYGKTSLLYFMAISTLFAITECILNFKIEFTKLDGDSKIKLPSFSKLLVICFVASTIITYVFVVLQNGLFTFDAFNLEKTYEIRANFKLNKYIGYIYYWQYIVINPFMIVRGIERKKPIVVVTYVILQLISFLYQAQKIVLFTLFLIIFSYYISQNKQLLWKMFNVALLLISLLSVMGLLQNISSAFYIPYTLFVRRMLIDPAMLKYIYYDFFSVNEHIGLGGTLWGQFLGVEYPYDVGWGKLIGKEYFYSEELSANTGFYAEGFFRFGYWGLILVFLLFILLLLLIDFLAHKTSSGFAIALSIFSVMLLNDGGIINELIFGNFTLIVIICLLYDKKEDFNLRRRKNE